MADPVITIPVDLDLLKAEKELEKFKSKTQSLGSFSLEQTSKTLSNSFGLLAKGVTIAAAAAVAGIAVSLKKGVDEAIKQQNAINDLNRALAASGQFTEKASKDFQNFASSLQDVSTFGDDIILQNAALIQSLGRLDAEGLKRATRAAADLSSALGIDLATASTLVGKAAAGEIGSFSRFGLTIQKGATDAETFANALNKIESSFGGAATSKLNTFEGQLLRTSNAFGDILEGFGLSIVKSSSLTALVKTLGDELTVLANKAAKVDLSNFINVENLIAFANAINNFVIAPFELAFNIARIGFNTINTFVAGVVRQIGAGAGQIADLLNKIGVDNGFTQGLQSFRESSQAVLDENKAALEQSVDGLFNGTVFGKGEEFIQNLQTNLENAKASIESSGIRNSLNPAAEGEKELSFGQALADEFKVGEMAASDFNKNVKTFAQQTRANLLSGVANGAGQAFAAFGAALANGENGLKAFTDSFIKSIGQIAVQQGTAFILQGIGYQFIAGKQGLGLGLIKAGAALAAFGGALSAATGGGGASGAGAGGGVTGPSTIEGQSIIDPRSGIAAPQERLEPSTAVTVNIQGDVFDSEETGLRISNILRDASLNQNVRASVFA